MDLELACGHVKVTIGYSNRFRVKSYCKNFNFLIVAVFTLRIVRLNHLQVFTLKRFISLIFLGYHIVVLFTFCFYA